MVNNQILLIEELRRNHQLMGLSSENPLTEAPVVQPQWVRNIVRWVEEGRALGKSWGANTTELGRALRSLKNAKGNDILPAIARISRLSSELANEIGVRVYNALKTRPSYKSIFDATKAQGVSNLNAGMDESRMIQQVDALLEAGITNPEVRGMVRGPLIEEIKAAHAQAGGGVTPSPGGQGATSVTPSPGGTTPVTPIPSVTNAIVGGEDEELAREFIKELRKRGLKVSTKNIEEIKAAIKDFSQLIKGFTDRFSNRSYAAWDEFAGEGVDVKKIMETWETLPVKKQQEIIKNINKNMEEAFGKWIAGFRLSENSQNVAVQFFHNFFYKKVIMLGKTPKGLGDWVSWYYYSVLYSFAAMTIAEVIACTKNGFSKSCLNILTNMGERLSLSVIPFFNMAWGGANVLYQTIVSIAKGLSPYVGGGSTREEGFFSTDLSEGEAQSFVENDNGLSGLLPPGLDMSKFKFIYKEVEGKNNQVDVYMMETGQKEEDAAKVATLEKVLSPGKQAGDFQAYRIRVK